ncbi:MAG TPA: YtxH domain-containing protein [Bacteroidia bacterium]|nr:YtxH domain-containing protein [Bacteroidia bacterium]
MNSGKIVLGALAGLAAGAVLGILFAPDKGSKTRAKILSKSGECADSLKEKYNELVDMVTSKAEEAEQMVEKGKAKYDEAKRDVKNATA